ncbi:MAG: hypothetical protein JSR24_20395 [Proteobacteria bacterium]|nr:hypothetical protein [Pseudomonadota bacterium]
MFADVTIARSARGSRPAGRVPEVWAGAAQNRNRLSAISETDGPKNIRYFALGWMNVTKLGDSRHDAYDWPAG